MARTLGILAMVLLALLVRLPGMGESLWYDEVYHTDVYFQDPARLRLLLMWEDVHPPLYAAFMLGWTRVFGDGEFSIRLPSLLAGLLSLLLVWRIAQAWLGSGQAWLVAGLLALSPPHIWYPHESKANRCMVLLTTAAIWCFWSAAQEGRWLDWAAGAAVLLAALYNHPYAVPVAAGIFVWLAWRALGQPELRRPLLLLSLVTGLGFLPMVAAKFLVRGESLERWYLRDLSPRELYRLLLGWLPHGNTLAGEEKVPVELLLAALLARGLFRQFQLARGSHDSQAWSARLLLLWFLMPMGATLIFSALAGHAYIERNMLAVLPGFLLLLVSGASGFQRRWLSLLAKAGLAALAVASTLLLVVIKPDETTVFHLKPDWRAAAAWLTSQTKHPEVFVTNPTSELAYYAPGRVSLHEISSVEALREAESGGWRPASPFYLVLNGTWKGCWNEVWPYLARNPHYRLAEVREFRGLTLYKFAARSGESGPDRLTFDLGGDTQSLFSTTGFHSGEKSADGTFVWNSALLSSLSFWLEPAQGDYLLELRGRRVEGVPQVRLRVGLNGLRVGELNWTSDSLQTRRLPLARSTLRRGENLLDLEYDVVSLLSATDSRQGSLCLDWIRLSPR